MRVSGILIMAVSATIIAFLIGFTVSDSSGLNVLFGTKPIVSEASAKSFPLEVTELYTQKRFVGDGARYSYQMQVIENYIDDTKHCEFCTRVTYVPGAQGISAFSFSDVAGYDLTGAKRVKLFIMGENGGESVSIKAAGKAVKSGLFDKMFNNMRFATETTDITLEKNWKVVQIDLRGKDLKGITDPIAFEVKQGRNAQPVTFYVKQVLFEAESPENPIPAKS